MKRVLAVAVLALVARGQWCGGGDSAPIRVATFNIENYPRSERQIRGAFALIRELDAAAIGVQEITDPEAFARHAREHLGPSWRFVYCDPCPVQRVGVLYDDDVLDLLTTHDYDEAQTYRGAKPAFEARLRPDAGGEVLRVVVVHLKSHRDYVDTRRRQLLALQPVMRKARQSGERVVLLGDFNATSDDDREALRRFADATGLHWSSRDLECTSYWNRAGECPGTPLDHVFSSDEPRSIAARGACESEGCNPGESCPTYVRDISDHCPVALDLR